VRTVTVRNCTFESVYCASTPSSAGSPAEIGGPCVARLTDGTLRFAAAPVPAGTSVLLLGTPAAAQPFGDGVLCLGAVLRRSDPASSSGGAVAFDVDAASLAPGATIGLQVQFRDPRAGGTGFNLSTAMRLVVLP
jgi:hypothetical protein